MAAFEWVPATAEDIPFLAAHARQADCDELWASARMTPAEAMEYGLNHSEECWVGKIHGEPVCMFGVALCDWSTAYGAAWMVGTDGIDAHPAAFLKGSRAAIARMLHVRPVLCNFVDARHEKAIRWLKLLGATFQAARPYGEANLPFHFFELRG